MRACRITMSCAICAVWLLTAGCSEKTGAHKSPVSSSPVCPAASQTPKAEPDAGLPLVVLVNKDYNRLSSNLMVRRVRTATRAALDFSVYDSNIMTFDPKPYELSGPGREVSLKELDFGGALDKDSLCDRIESTPLSPEERSAPLAWLPASELLINWNYDLAAAFVECGAKVSGEKWGNDDVPVACQEITRLYFHRGAGQITQAWVRVEFKPWVKFLKDVDDEDSDGFPEIYARLPSTVVRNEIVEHLLGDYSRKRLSREEVDTWAYELGSYWYPVYNTEALDEKKRKQWPDETAKAELGEQISVLKGVEPTIIIVGRPFGKNIYNVLIVEGMAE